MAYTTDDYVKAIQAAESAGDTESARKLTQAMAQAMQQPRQLRVAPAEAPALEQRQQQAGLAATAAQGLTLGMADELAGLTGGPEAQQRMRRQVAQFRQRSPYLAIGAEMAGGIPLGLGIGAGLRQLGAAGRAMAAPAMTPQAGLGAAQGAVYGAGVGRTPAERVRGGVVGAGLGAVGGAVAAPLAGAITRRFSPGMEAQKLIRENMRQDLGRTPTAIDFAEMQYRAGQQPQRTLAEIAGPTTEDLARTSAKMPAGGARRLAEETLEIRRQGATNRLIKSLQETTGSREDYWRNIRNLEAKAKQDAKPLYDAARAAEFVPDEELMDLAARGVDTGEIKAGYEAARRQTRLREGKQIPTWKELTEEGGPGLENLDMETWDWVKRGLDARYKKVVRQDPAMAAAIWDYRQQLVAKLDDMVPDYREARRLYAGPMEQRDAQLAGRNIFKEDAEYTEEFVAELSRGEKDAYITGAVQAIKDKLKSVPVEGGMPRFTQLGFDRLRAAFPSDEAAGEFLRQVLDERDMQRFRNMILSGSPTAEIMASQEQAGRTLGVAGGIGQVLTGQPMEGVRTVAGAMRPRRAVTIPERINRPLSQMLFAQGQAVAPALRQMQALPYVPTLLPPTLTTEGTIFASQAQPRPNPAQEKVPAGKRGDPELEELRRRLGPDYEILED